MKYTDKDGDTWEETSDGRLRCVSSEVFGFEGSTGSRKDVETFYGPLREGDVDPNTDDEDEEDTEEPELPTVESVMERVDVFRAAHAMVTNLEWEEKPSVYDVLQIAKWLEGEG
ncbi:hypothetical protein ABZ352_35510 [Streptomyces griseofuscus]|uniref:hypothetical protein n=1 Tax=Streptomyces griseofuscus TaxID=146922 RepID=UPI00340610F2